ncbi:hydroxyisourate hydrolase [Erwinia sp. Leaf53]|uniref:hydroxyisourate hydrolase n=1 Tax=Erwinia sp. Leaf53 TaxID=1736225 RepID=UPI0006F53D20|nr:hydroxyisourate hydrolase [Erwinia sp. Leaf53]KQN55435.1 5-hydroxyisourate hydrolase [Erwinia sp. Leaf53]
MSSLSSHILDISTGRPAAGVMVRLEHYQPNGYSPIGSEQTDDNGRIARFCTQELPPGRYRLTAETGDWFRQRDISTPFVQAQIEVMLEAGQGHYHLPFVIAPGGWSTYRGN